MVEGKPNMAVSEALRQAREVFDLEIEALRAVSADLGRSFEQAAELILGCEGLVFIAGVGKSGLVAQKIAATLSSTGTPAAFVHPVEAVHGDVGMIRERDMVMLLSQSGETSELFPLLDAVRRRGIPVVSLTGNLDSTIARAGTVAVAVRVEREACPLRLAPTSSTTAMLCLGDAMAVVLLEKRGFREEDFARLHPAGPLGRRLLLKVTRVKELMHGGEENPLLQIGKTVRQALPVLEKRLGGVNVVDDNGLLLGLITDGDLKRGLSEFDTRYLDLKVEEVMTESPITVEAEALAAEAVNLLENRPTQQFSVLPVVDHQGRAVGMIRLHDLVRASLV